MDSLLWIREKKNDSYIFFFFLLFGDFDWLKI